MTTDDEPPRLGLRVELLAEFHDVDATLPGAGPPAGWGSPARPELQLDLCDDFFAML
jgi:hypothetical protein